MNDLQTFNKALEYIDNHLDSRIEESDIYNLTSYSYDVFARIFSILSGIPLGEYIRSRRLSEAAIELQETRSSVATIAMKYGYSSSDAFSYAFRNFHACSPTDVRRGSGFQIAQPLRFSLTVRGGEFETKIEQKEAFRIYGICENIRPEMMSIDIWQELCYKLRLTCRSSWLDDQQLYGLFFQDEKTNGIRYMIGYKVTEAADEGYAKRLDLDIIDIPAMKYAVVTLNGEIPTNIHQAWTYLIGTFLPQEGYKHSESYDFELYSGYNSNDPNFNIELWVPITKRPC